MAAVIRAPCLCLWCLPGVASVPCVLPCRPDPHSQCSHSQGCQECYSVGRSSFNKLVSSLCHLSILHIPLSSDSFLLQTDASYVGISGCLSVCRDNQELPVAFYSRQLRDVETRYSVSEIECLAAVESIKHFLVYHLNRSSISWFTWMVDTLHFRQIIGP